MANQNNNKLKQWSISDSRLRRIMFWVSKYRKGTHSHWRNILLYAEISLGFSFVCLFFYFVIVFVKKIIYNTHPNGFGCRLNLSIINTVTQSVCCGNSGCQCGLPAQTTCVNTEKKKKKRKDSEDSLSFTLPFSTACSFSLSCSCSLSCSLSFLDFHFLMKIHVGETQNINTTTDPFFLASNFIQRESYPIKSPEYVFRASKCFCH